MKSMSILRTSAISVPPPHRPVCEARRPAGAVAGQQAVDMLTLLQLVPRGLGSPRSLRNSGGYGPRAPATLEETRGLSGEASGHQGPLLLSPTRALVPLQPPGTAAECDAQGHLVLVPLRALNERLRCHGTRMWTVAEIGSGVEWSVLPNSCWMNVFE